MFSPFCERGNKHRVVKVFAEVHVSNMTSPGLSSPEVALLATVDYGVGN